MNSALQSEDWPDREALAVWPNCETPDCEHKQCTWSGTPFCFPCAERVLGHEALIALYNATHDLTWDEAEELERLEEQLEECEAQEAAKRP